MVDPLRCAETAEQRGDPREGSVPYALGWLLVEHPGPWARQALEDSGLPGGVVSALLALARRAGARPTLIRRPGLRGGGPLRRWALIDSRPGHESVRWGSYRTVDELASLDTTTGSPSPEPVYLVCTHGRHDTCCAVRGRPVAAALAGKRREQTWECSHVGGDRFAANLVVLPHGFYYGHLIAGTAEQIAEAYESGRVDPRWLRGRCSLPAPVQAAQHRARLHLAEPGVDALPLLGIERVGEQSWAVTLRGSAGTLVTVTVAARTAMSSAPLTCSATAPSSVRTFDLLGIVATEP